MSTTHAEPNYFTIIVILAVLTAVEVAVVFLPLPHLMIGILLVGLALTKAVMVALYFMHLKFEKTTLALIAATPLVLCTLLMFALLPDHNPDNNMVRGEFPVPFSKPGTYPAPPEKRRRIRPRAGRPHLRDSVNHLFIFS